MRRETLVDFFEDLAAKAGEFLVYDDGFRTRRYQYREVAAAARGFAGRLHEAGLRKGDAVLFWAENRPEWIAAFWGCVLAGVVVVPIDFRSSAEFARRVGGIVRARVALVGDDVTAPDADGQASLGADIDVWRLSHLDWRDRAAHPPSRWRETMSPRSSSRRAQRPSPRASSSPTATCWPTSSPSSARC